MVLTLLKNIRHVTLVSLVGMHSRYIPYGVENSRRNKVRI